MTEPSPPPHVVGFGPHEGPPAGGHGSGGGGSPPPAGGFGAPPGGGFGVPPGPAPFSPPAFAGAASGSAAELERNAKMWLAVALASAVLCAGGCLLGLTGAAM